ncbi:hypothetical protein [Agromyces sp. H66]|uniref:hypothetical protein n=1 Tax=Agromyces sp. H66 TaxID=2529859 RepID=UPI0010AAB68D|nr:hypothetical protein [Agromyces sp. H66]
MSPRRRARPLLFGSLALTAAVTLSGCIATTPTETGTPAATPTTSAGPAIAEGPEPRIGADCDDIVDAAALQEFLGVIVTPLAPEAPADLLGPDTAAVVQLGALSCTWTNGLPHNPYPNDEPDRQLVRLSILPEGLDQAVAYVDTYDSRDPTYGEGVQGPRCLGPMEGVNTGYCELFGVIGQTWVELVVEGVVVDADTTAEDLVEGFRTVFDPMVSTLETTTALERWSPATPSSNIPVDCDVLTPTAEIAAVTAVPELRVGPQWDGPRVGQYWYGLNTTGAARCSLAIATSDASLGQIGILPSGAWGFSRFAESWLVSGGTSVTLPEVDGAEAIARCDDAVSDCVIDFAVAGDWGRVTVYPQSPAGVDAGRPAGSIDSARAAAVDIAAIVARHMAVTSWR